MKLSARQLASFSMAGFVLSLLVHILTLTEIYFVSKISLGALTVGIVAIWLSASAFVKDSAPADENPWKMVFTSIPDWLRYAFFTIIIYVLVNSFFSFEFKPEKGYLDTSISPSKIRLLSGFWLLFYALGFIVGMSGNRPAEEE